jgi:hypothetical protein
MTEPVVNHSIKSFHKLSGSPASSSSYTPSIKGEDWGSKQKRPNATAPSSKLFKAPTGYMTPLKQMGINPQYQISLPCKEVNELSNKRIHQGKGRSFDKQAVKAIPITGMDTIAFSPEMRIGTIGANLTQKPFTFNSFLYC